MNRRFLFTSLFFLLVSSACKDRYVPHINYPSTGYLVVEGFIDAGAGDTTHIRVSRTTTLDSSYYRAETGATLTVESSNNQTWPLAGNGSGDYSGVVPVNPDLQYRLRITSSGRNYVSDFVETRITPPIDSVHWEEQSDGVQIDVSSHDPANKTIYYMWGFTETWKYNSRYFSDLIWENGALQNRTDSQQVYYCWKTDTSSTVLLGSTAKLSRDIVANQPLTFIPFSAPFNKLIIKYSVLVTESALTEDEYDWYDKLKKNTESLGSIFDAQPSELTGNIHSLTDSTETVIGWLGCRTQTTQRIFISRAQLTVKSLSSGDELCELDTLKSADEKTLGSGGLVPTNYFSNGVSITGVGASTAICVDCRVKGGVLTKPSFWID